MTSWRTAAVTLLSFSSGLPLGVVWIAVPDWLRSAGVDLRTVGLITLAQAPWTFKFLWSPLLDRYSLGWLGRRRGWLLATQVALTCLMFALAGVGDDPQAPWVVGAVAFAIALASATQDIVYDAYTVEVLLPEEQGVAVGAKTAFYMTAYRAVPALGIWLAARWSWPAVDVVLGLLFVPLAWVTVRAPEPASSPGAPRTMREAVWLPFLGFLGRHRALEILAFVFFYKFADNLAVSLLRPFLFDLGYSAADRGLWLTWVTWGSVVIGTLIGGTLTEVIGLGPSLWLFGSLQLFANLGYVLVARSPVDRPLMLGAAGFENFAQGLGTGAFTVLLLRLTQRRFSATQYALFSSLFGLPRVIAGPIAGFSADAFGWEAFFWMTLLAGIPGLVLLQRFAPLGTREPRIELRPPHASAPLRPAALWARGAVGGLAGLVGAAVCAAAGASIVRGPGTPVPPGFTAALAALAAPGDAVGWLRAAGVAVFGVFAGLLTAAVAAARHGAGAGGE
jgi:PAT family beta-lactamase induction signal transducer AmpG